jgi:hypothetical protein
MDLVLNLTLCMKFSPDYGDTTIPYYMNYVSKMIFYWEFLDDWRYVNVN